MRSFYVILFLLLGVSGLFSYQNSLPSLYSPSALERNQGEFSVFHRFYGAVDEEIGDTVFGMMSGANVGFSFRRNVYDQAELKAAYTKAQKRLDIGASWDTNNFDLPIVAQIDLSYTGINDPSTDEREHGWQAMISAQNTIYAERIALTINAGYDGIYQRLINGFGASIRTVGDLWIIGEYYPVWDRESDDPDLAGMLGEFDTYSFGIKYNTYGHQFMISLSNGYNLNPATQSMGSFTDSDLFLGFNIQRRF